MKPIIKFTLTAFALLSLGLSAASLSTSASTRQKSPLYQEGGVHLKAGPCVHLRNPTSCINYPTGECFWDDADQRCESYRNEDRCSTIYSVSRCENSVWNCFWDYDDQRCERRW
ncbi:MAG: hypothetical protein KC505_04865 [Myxococcales bacterium]|nr:hypothetical protein [Myxococcales bacterium]USN51079.1 MAG: hypothetical protein H6731_01325 [Myxococcales bacterium]